MAKSRVAVFVAILVALPAQVALADAPQAHDRASRMLLTDSQAMELLGLLDLPVDQSAGIWGDASASRPLLPTSGCWEVGLSLSRTEAAKPVDILLPGTHQLPDPRPDPAAHIFTIEDIELSTADSDKVLTFLRQVSDEDKDGFADSAVGEVNPNGYVVLHFRSNRHNVRLTLGQYSTGLLASEVAHSSGPLLGEAGSGPLGREPDPNPPTQVPEPATSLLLLLAVPVILRRRTPRRPATAMAGRRGPRLRGVLKATPV